MNKSLLPMLATALIATGCASSNRSDNERFRIESTPEQATATLSTGESCLTPCHFDLPRSDNFRVTISKEGFKPVTKTIRSVKSKTGGAPASASVSLGGLINVPIGSQSGASYDLEPNPLEVELSVKR